MKLYVFSDCHVDGVSTVMSTSEYLDLVEEATRKAAESGGLIVFLGDNEDVKNSLRPSETEALSRTIGMQFVTSKHLHVHGNHDDVSWCEANQHMATRLPSGEVLMAHHGYFAKYGNRDGSFTPGCGKFMRAIKTIGVWYRKVFPWKLSEKAEKYLEAYKNSVYPYAKICVSGHEHPRELVTFERNGARYYVFPQGYTEVDV